MRRSSLPLLVAAGALCAVTLPTAARAQRGSNIEIRTRGDGAVECRRDGRRVDCESLRGESARAAERAADARRRAEEVRRREHDREMARVRESTRRSAEA